MPRTVERAVTTTLEAAPADATQWSTRSLARATGLSQTAVCRIWRAFGLKPHRVETFKLSQDPLFVEKVRDIVGLYLAPPDRAFLDEIDRGVPPDLEVHLVLDNLRTHKTGLIQDWLAKRPRYHLHFTPTSASWLNLVEGWFAPLTLRQIRRGAFPTVEALEAAIRAYIDGTNPDPRPFVWTKSADEILDSVRRFCLRTTAAAECQVVSNSPH